MGCVGGSLYNYTKIELNYYWCLAYILCEHVQLIRHLENLLYDRILCTRSSHDRSIFGCIYFYNIRSERISHAQPIKAISLACSVYIFTVCTEKISSTH